MKNAPGLSARLISPPGGLLPGEVLRAVLEVHVPPPLSLIEVDAAFVGVERVDQAWISSAWRSKVGAINNDARRVQRPLVHCSLCAACLTGLPAASTRRFIIQLWLPAWLPPSYKGTALRVGYQLQAVVRYQVNDGLGTPSSPVGISPTRAVHQHALRCTVNMWPQESPDMDRMLESLQSLRPPQGRIHCWEVGPGADMSQVFNHLEMVHMDDDEESEEIGSARGGVPHVDRGAVAMPMDGSSTEDGFPFLSETPSTRVFALRMDNQPLARVVLFPPLDGGAVFAPGDTISLCIDFDAKSALRCMQVRVSLESEEAVATKWRAGRSGSKSSTSNDSVGDGPAYATSARAIHVELVETTVHSSRCGVVIGVPLDATPSFMHPLCVLRWHLCFAFSSVEQPDSAPRGSTPWHEPTATLAWNLPITVAAASIERDLASDL